MKTHEIATSVVALTFLLAPCKVLSAQKPNCGEIDAIARMARAISTAELAANREKAGESYRAQLVYAAKLLELLITLGEHHCETESYHEMKMLAQLEERLPRDLTRAVLMVPAKIPEYVAYSITSVEDPHSDYAIQMQKVCRAKHDEFFDAVAKLPREKRDRFLKYVFDLDGCNALTLPEAQ